MSLPPLATVPQLAAYLQQPLALNDPTALLYLQIVSGMIRDHLQQDITATAADVVLFDPIGPEPFVFLPQMPVTAVTLVETFDATVTPGVWSTADPKTYTVSKRVGVIAGKPWTGVQWPSDPESWRVTYDHGFMVVPDGMLGVVLGVAAREYVTVPAVELERIGGYQVKYQIGGGFNDLETKVLDRYRVVRVA